MLVQLLKVLPQFSYDPSRSFRARLATVVGNKWRELNRRRRPQTVPGTELLDKRPRPTTSTTASTAPTFPEPCN